MPDTIFSKIIAGEVPCHRVYEDDLVLAFLDVNPLSYGHTLVIPKEARATLGELSDDSAAAIGRVLPRLCRAVAKAAGVADSNVVQNNGAPAGQAVLHVHFHIIPRMPDEPEGRQGVRLVWKPGKLENGEELAEKIRARLD